MFTNAKTNRSGPGMIRRRIGGTLLAVAMAVGSVAIGATAAQAAQPTGCSVNAGTPYKTSGGSIAGTGTGTCSTSSDRTFIYQVHRSEGWWHPNVAQAQQSGSRTSYSATASNCDANSGSGTWQYFGQAFFSGYTADFSPNTTDLAICG